MRLLQTKQEVNKMKVDQNIEEMFPDWDQLEKGDWSQHGRIFDTPEGRRIEIGLYREPDENEEYAGTLTLQIFVNDSVVLCEKVSWEEPMLLTRRFCQSLRMR